mmetsp:Transcript_23705/g.34812  ORF Transcript_23705/g.34812 Transcript_23705/m.34812 type:complete len:113 (-) Transcript_23705:282-620(-)
MHLRVRIYEHVCIFIHVCMDTRSHAHTRTNNIHTHRAHNTHTPCTQRTRNAHATHTHKHTNKQSAHLLSNSIQSAPSSPAPAKGRETTHTNIIDRVPESPNASELWGFRRVG